MYHTGQSYNHEEGGDLIELLRRYSPVLRDVFIASLELHTVHDGLGLDLQLLDVFKDLLGVFAFLEVLLGVKLVHNNWCGVFR